MLIVTPELAIGESEIEEKFVRASGPGGQNVNKVATTVQLRFDIRHSPSLPEAVRERLLRLAANRVYEVVADVDGLGAGVWLGGAILRNEDGP